MWPGGRGGTAVGAKEEKGKGTRVIIVVPGKRSEGDKDSFRSVESKQLEGKMDSFRQKGRGERVCNSLSSRKEEREHDKAVRRRRGRHGVSKREKVVERQPVAGKIKLWHGREMHAIGVDHNALMQP